MRVAYRCEFLGISTQFGLHDTRLQVRMLEPHADRGGNVGEVCITSRVRTIDFERGVAVTQHSIYHWSTDK